MVGRYTQAVGDLIAKAALFPDRSELRQRIAEIQPTPTTDAGEGWVEEARRRIDRVQAAAQAYQSSADEQLYKSNSAVRSACQLLSKSTRLDLAGSALLEPGAGLIAQAGITRSDHRPGDWP